MITEILEDRASTHSGLSALIGAGASCRFYPLLIPEKGTLPAVSYQLISNPSRTSRDGQAQQRWQMVAHASTYTAARQVAEQLKSAFEWEGATSGGEYITSMYRVNELDLPYDEVLRRYRVLVDFIAHTID